MFLLFVDDVDVLVLESVDAVLFRLGVFEFCVCTALSLSVEGSESLACLRSTVALPLVPILFEEELCCAVWCCRDSLADLAPILSAPSDILFSI